MISIAGISGLESEEDNKAILQALRTVKLPLECMPILVNLGAA